MSIGRPRLATEGLWPHARFYRYKGRATYVDQVCEAGTSTCSNEATVRFGGGPPN